MGLRQWDNMHQLVQRSWHVRQSWFNSSFFFLSSLFFLYHFVSTSFINFVQLLYCLIAFCIFNFFYSIKVRVLKISMTFSLENRNRLKPKYHRNRQFPTISVGFGWEFHKPKYSVSVGHTHTKPIEPNRAHPYVIGFFSFIFPFFTSSQPSMCRSNCWFWSLSHKSIPEVFVGNYKVEWYCLSITSILMRPEG